MKLKTKTRIAKVLSVAGIATTIGAVICSGKATNDSIKDGMLTVDNRKERFKKYWKKYIPTVALTTASVGCQIASTVIFDKVNVGLTSSLALLTSRYIGYRNKIKSNEEQPHKKFLEDMAKQEYKNYAPKSGDDSRLYYEEHIGFFECSEIDLQNGLVHINKLVSDPEYQQRCIWGGYHWGYATLREFLDGCNADLLTTPENPNVLDMGWSDEYLANVYADGAYNIRITLGKINYVYPENGDNPYAIIEFEQDPIPEPRDFDYEMETLVNAKELRK